MLDFTFTNPQFFLVVLLHKDMDLLVLVVRRWSMGGKGTLRSCRDLLLFHGNVLTSHLDI